MPTWARTGASGLAILRETAERAYTLAETVPHDRLPDVSKFIDLHLAAMLNLKKLVARGDADDVATLYKNGIAPEQIDPRTLQGHFCGCLRHSASIVRAVTRTVSGRRVTMDLLHKAMSPDEARVRYVDSNAIESVKEPDGVMRRLINIAVFGGAPGVKRIANVETRLRYWDDAVGMVRLIISKLMKRGILLALAEAISRLPCALLRSVVAVRVQGGICAALFSNDGPPKNHIRVIKTGVIVPRSEPCIAPQDAKFPNVSPERVLDGMIKFGTVGSRAMPQNAEELEMLKSIVARSHSVRVFNADPKVRAEQMRRIGLATVHFCTSCHTVHGISATKVSKAQRVVTIFGPEGARCSGCGSKSVVRLDLTGRVLQLAGPKGKTLMAPCTDCAAVGPISAVYGGLPYCNKHAVDEAAAKLDSGPPRCAICTAFVHGTSDSAAIECEDKLHRLCIPCHSKLPTNRWTRDELELLQSKRGSRP